MLAVARTDSEPRVSGDKNLPTSLMQKSLRQSCLLSPCSLDWRHRAGWRPGLDPLRLSFPLISILCFTLIFTLIYLLYSETGEIIIVDANIWSCWVGVLFLSFYCPLWFLEGCGSCVLPDREFFWDPDRCIPWVFQVKCISRYW